MKKVFLKISQNSQENTSFFNKVTDPRPATLLKKESLAQVFSCEFCQIFKNTFFTEHLRKTNSSTQLLISVYGC